MILTMMVCLCTPLIFYIGPMQLTPYRLLLLLAFLPMVAALLTGRAGRLVLPDLLMVVYACWAAGALLAVDGLQRLEFSGMFIVETLGAYLFARVYVSDRESFVYFARVLFGAVAFLLPIALVEATTNVMILNRLADIVGGTIADINQERRLGLERVQGPFNHSILFGVFCSSAFALAYYPLREDVRNMFAGVWRLVLVAVAVFLSLSTGAYLAVVLQGALIGWDQMLQGWRRRWLLLGGLVAGFYGFVSLASNRTPVEVFITYFTFNAGNAWNRIHIWNYASADVARHWLFGIGQRGDWERPHWMPSSVDHFWLATALRHGLVAILLLISAYLALLVMVGRAPLADRRDQLLRRSVMMTIIGVSLALCTVHVWGATYILFLMLLGSGCWLIANPDVPMLERAGAKGLRRSRPGPATFARSDAVGGLSSPRRSATGSSLSGAAGRDDAVRGEAGPSAV
ncbi:O-antigen ligase family protein [Rubrimonas cliftonensis]|uniref:O-Antigen ligase n=1 Tax=Rubrimonas cliftonensis TaxID=89524 RepID=A0A1H4CU46_9RHOB|nr:O-antigen ligase family protein [Rubrimonas cliftonensis]SEA63877.1 O-Antigen ligase [Rubrimonas cliftonensis]